jgi:fermentation-respiration switch protein FrsA (DUF1100 family)
MGVKRRIMLLTLSALLAFVTLLLLLIWWQQERIVFQPSGPPYPEASAQRVEYRAADGQPLFAYVVRPRDVEPRGVLLAFHGNADLAANLVPWGEEVTNHTGWLVMLAEYRGYGGLPGTPTARGARLDALAAAAFAHDSLGARHERFALYGHSLGSAVAAELASEIPASRLLLESPFTSARDMARIIIARPISWAWGLISRVHYDTGARVRALDIPVSVAHGEEDFIIPVRMGRAVFEMARVRGALLIVRGAGHNDIGAVGGEQYWSWIAGALSADSPAPQR